MSLPHYDDDSRSAPQRARPPLPARHPHRLNALGISPAREQSIESVKTSLASLEGAGLRAGLQVLTVIELLAAEDVEGALDALDDARVELQGLQ